MTCLTTELKILINAIFLKLDYFKLNEKYVGAYVPASEQLGKSCEIIAVRIFLRFIFLSRHDCLH
jgi:hypothetical protein